MTPRDREEIAAVLGFWFDEASHEQRFAKNADFDATIRRRFLGLTEEAMGGGRSHWRETADGALAEIILIDQFPRNLFRESPRAFASDALAREASRAAVAVGHDLAMSEERRVFCYLPLEHSEALADQEECHRLMSANAPDFVIWSERHKVIIERFGRFPHRNAALGRETTAEERAFLDEPHSSF